MKSYINATPDSTWIKNNSKLPWLKLNMDIPFKDIELEWESVKHLAVLHRNNDKILNSTHNGWKSLTLYGAGSTITTQTENQNLDWTDIATKCSKTVNWIKQNFILNENTGRIRFMLLEPGGYILPHTDRIGSGLREINVAITQPKSCYFKFKNHGIIPFNSGEAYIIDTSIEHAVYNNSDFPRLHMILHTEIADEIIERSYVNCYHIKN